MKGPIVIHGIEYVTRKHFGNNSAGAVCDAYGRMGKRTPYGHAGRFWRVDDVRRALEVN